MRTSARFGRYVTDGLMEEICEAGSPRFLNRFLLHRLPLTNRINKKPMEMNMNRNRVRASHVLAREET